MTLVQVRNETEMTGGYRSERCRGLYNVEVVDGCVFEAEFAVPGWGEAGPDGKPWQIGVVVGPSGTGKTSIGRKIGHLWDNVEWAGDRPIVEEIVPEGSFEQVTGALATVGLGAVPTWLRPYHVLSNGEQFRANLARIMAEKPARVAIDEFTSVVDRQVAQVGAGAFSKAWRRDNPEGQVVLLTCHYDVLEWINPDWVLDTESLELSWAVAGAATRAKNKWSRPEGSEVILTVNVGSAGDGDVSVYRMLRRCAECGTGGQVLPKGMIGDLCLTCYNQHRRESGQTSQQILAQFVRDYKEERQCSDCTERRPLPYYQLDLDHRPDEQKTATISALVRQANRALLEAELAKCDVVCSHCHRERTHSRGYTKVEAPS